MKLLNIKFGEYLLLSGELRDKYDFAIKYGVSFTKEIDNYKCGDLKHKSFQLIKDFQFDYNKGLSWNQLLEYFCKFTRFDKKYFLNQTIQSIAQFKTYLIKQIDLINLVEQIELSHNNSEVEESSGIDKFEMFGFYPQFSELANGDITKMNTIANMPYEKCFIELSYRKRCSDFQVAMQGKYNERLKSNG